jgi:hypothetical protein
MGYFKLFFEDSVGESPHLFFILIIGEKTYRCTRCAKRSLEAQTEKREKN